MSEHLPMLALLKTDADRFGRYAALDSCRTAIEPLLETTLNLLPVKIVITGTDGRILHVNEAAATMIAAGDPIWSRHGRICAATSAATAALIAAIGDGVQTKAGAHRNGSEVALPCRDGRAAIAHVRTLRTGDMRLGQCAGFAAAVFVIEPQRVVLPLAALAHLFDLSPSESRVLAEIVSGRNRKETAAALGIADSTVKTHLDRLYTKTGTSDQSELCRLVTSLSWPGECP